MPHDYYAYGLNIESEIECPHLMAGAGGGADVVIRLGTVPEELEQVRTREGFYDVGAGRFLLRTKGVARYLVSDGREIIVEPEPAAADNDIQLFLLGSAMGALLHQRGAWPLHGGAIETEHGAAVFVGRSGIGKSTLAGEFHRRGHRIFSDDVSVVSSGDDGILQVWPAPARIRLWSDSIAKLGRESDALSRVRPEMDKYVVPLEGFHHEPAMVRAVYVLEASEAQKTVELTALRGFEKVEELTKHTYRLRFLADINLSREYFEQAQALAKQARIVRITRPVEPFLLEELADAIVRDLAE